MTNDSRSVAKLAGARYLDPVTGQWTTVDLMAADYSGWSPYNYAANKPIAVIDPTGWIGTARQTATVN